MTFLITKELNQFNKAVKKTFRGFQSKKAKRLGGVLHAHKLDTNERKKMFRQIQNAGFRMYSIIIDKRKFHIDIYKNKHYLYATLANKLIDYIQGESQITLIASRIYTNKTHTYNFKEFLRNNVDDSINFTVEVGTSSQYKGLQIADACSWAIHRKYEFEDTSRYSFIKSKIAGEHVIFS